MIRLPRLLSDISQTQRRVDQRLVRIGCRRPSVAAREDLEVDLKRGQCKAALELHPSDHPTKRLYLAGKKVVERVLVDAVFSLPLLLREEEEEGPAAVLVRGNDGGDHTAGDDGAGVGGSGGDGPSRPPMAYSSLIRLASAVGSHPSALDARAQLEQAGTRAELRRAVRKLRRAIGAERLFESDFRYTNSPPRRNASSTPHRISSGTPPGSAPRSSASASARRRSKRRGSAG